MAQGIGNLLVTLGLDTRSMDKALGRAMGRFRSFGRNMKRAGQTMMGSVTGPLLNIGKEAFNVTKEFELSMAKVRAVSGATGDEFKRLEANAKELGRTTIFTASEVAGLQTEFAKLGFTATEIEGVTAATLNLAQATDSDLAQAAEVAGATLRGFGLDVSQTEHVTDVMAKAFSSSALDMESFQDAMKYVAPVAKAAGVSIEETTAMLGQMANSGIKGSQAGTSLRMIFQQLATGGGDVGEKMAALAEQGLTLDAAFDEVGRRAQTALLVLGDGKSGVDEMTESFRNADGAAADMAAIMDDTAFGAIKRMESAIEGAQIAMGTALAPTMEKISIIVGNVANVFTNMDSGMRSTVLTVTGIAAAVGPLLLILPQIGAAFSMIAGAISGPVLLAIAGVVAAIALIRTNWDSIVAYFTTGDGASFLESFKTMFITAVDVVVATWDFLVVVLTQLWEWFGGVITERLTYIFDFIVDVFTGAFDVLTNIFGIFTSAFQGDWDSMWQYLVNALVGAVQLILRGVDFMIGQMLQMIDFGLNAIGVESDFLGGWELIMEGAQNALEGLKYEMGETESAGASLFENLKRGFGSLTMGGSATKPEINNDVSGDGGMTQIAEDVGKVLQPMRPLSEILELPPQSKFQAFFNGFRDELTNTTTFIDQMAQSAQMMGESIGSAFVMMATGAEGGKQAMRDALSTTIDTAFRAATAHIIEAATATGKNFGPGAMIAIPALIGSGMALIRGLFKGLTGFADGGIVSGPVMGLVGEYAGARTNPEVIAPLNKLQSMLGGGQNVIVTGRISGNDIMISNERSRFDRGRIRGF
jgi:hypothetical protein